MLLVPAVAVARQISLRRAARILVATTAGTLCVLTPWAWRNATVFGTFVPVSTSFARTLWVGHNEDAWRGYTPEMHRKLRAIADEVRQGAGPEVELAMARHLTARAVAFALENPGTEFLLVPARIYHFFRGDHVWSAWYQQGRERRPMGPRTRRALERLSNLYFLALMIPALIGLARWARSPRPGRRMVVLYVGVWIAFFALLYADARYHFALMPLFVVAASDTLAGRRPRIPRWARLLRGDRALP
jgi:hypothetical protein